MTGKKIKILYAITKGNMGGAQKYVYDIATSLSKDDYDVSVLIGSDGTLNRQLINKRIKTIILGDLNRDINIFFDIKNTFKLFKIFRQEKPDIIHLNSSKMGLLGSLAGRFAKIPKIIFTGHGWAFNEERNYLQKKFLYFLHLLTISLAHKTISVSKKTKSQITKNDYINDKITVIKNGLSPINFIDRNTAREEIIKKLPSNIDFHNRLWLGTVSELHKNKGLKYIIEAIHNNKYLDLNETNSPILIIIGEGEERERLQKQINDYNLNRNIFLIGRIDQAPKYLKAFDIFTLTSITEALPYVILEAGQAGLPIIASAVGGIPEIIDDMKNGILIRAGEPNEINKALNFILKNTEKMEEFGKQIKTKIEKDFSQKQMIDEIIKLYLEK